MDQADPADQYFAELMESTSPVQQQQQQQPQPPPAPKSEVPYEELWLDHLKSRMAQPSLSEGSRGGGNNNNAAAGASVAQSYQPACSLGPIATSDLSLSPPPVPPKSEAVSIASLKSGHTSGCAMTSVESRCSAASFQSHTSFPCR